MQRKLSNNMKLLKALGNGPKTQAELMRETKVKNTYQIVADLKKKNLCSWIPASMCICILRKKLH
jgi:hypothetical protein